MRDDQLNPANEAAPKSVLVLGAYGLAGREITAGLLAKTGLRVIASGRRAEKLAALAGKLAHPHLSIRSLDAYDAGSLARASEDVDFVINAVGPYAVGGAEIARTVIQTRRPYIDFANEQTHYRKLVPLDQLARRNAVPLLTGAGLVPGISTLIALHGSRRLDDAREVDVYYAQGRTPDEDSGLGSVLGGILELSAMGARLRRRRESMPAPFGEIEMVAVPTLEALTATKIGALRSFENWWALGEVPAGTATLVRLLKPHKRAWAYRLFERLTRSAIRSEYGRAVDEGLTDDAILKVVVHSESARWEGTARVDNGGLGTAFLPVLAAKRLAEGRFNETGLVTPIDVFEPTATLSELAELGWKVAIEEAR